MARPLVLVLVIFFSIVILLDYLSYRIERKRRRGMSRPKRYRPLNWK